MDLRRYSCFILSLWLLLFSRQGFSTTVLQVDMDYMLTEASLIFEGEVISSQSQWNDEHTGIFTAIVFRVDDVVKGSYSSNTLTLNFSGGIVGDEGMRVSAMVYPDIGEKGIYFVGATNKNYVHPLVGWSQGHFLVELDGDGEQRVLTGRRELVTDIVDDAAAHALLPGAQKTFSEGVVHGIRTARDHGDKKQAMKKSDFKYVLKNKLQRK